jgi:Contractile injection system tube protein
VTTFAVAKLTLLPGKDKGQASTAGASTKPRTVDVQFNPTSLRVQRQVSQRRSGLARKDQRVQYSSSNAATLSFDLEFDTAEEVSGDGQPVSVRTRTDPIHALVEPPRGAPASAPHRVLFEWGSFAFQGVVMQITEDFDYFATDGTPLRAKMSLSIEEQDPKYAALEKGSGARTDRAATGPGGAFTDFQRPQVLALEPSPGATPGHGGTRDPMGTVAARAGESVQQLATRVGGDPAAWRSLMSGLTSPVGLAAGTPVVIGPELDTPATIGQALGFAAGVITSQVQDLAAALGLAAAGSADLLGPVSTALDPTEAAGFALSAAGGLAAATQAVLAADTTERVRAARSAFVVPARPAMRAGRQAGPAAEPTGVSNAQLTPQPGFPPTVDVDPRALSYGRSLPLRSRVHTRTGDEARAGGSRSLTARARPAELLVSGVRAAPPWERLPRAASGRAAADLAQRSRDARASTMRWKPGGGCR